MVTNSLWGKALTRSPGNPRVRSSRLALPITLAVQVLTSMASLTVPVLAPDIATATGMPAQLAGVYIGVVYAGAILSSLISGAFIARFGAIRVSQLCLILSGAGLALAGTGQMLALGTSAILLGLGYGAVTPASSHILARTTPPDRMALMFSLKQTGVPLGGAMAGLLAPLAAGIFDWQIALRCTGLLCLLMAALCQPLRREMDADAAACRSDAPHAGIAELLRGTAGHLLSPLRLIFASPRLRDMAFCSLFFGAVQLCFTTFMVVWLTEVHAMSVARAGGVLALAQAAGVAGRLLWGWLADRFVAARRMLAMLGLLMASAALLFALSTPAWPTAVIAGAAMLAGASAIGWNGVYLAEVARLAPPGEAGRVTGGTLSFTFLGVVVGPPAFAAVVGATGSFAPAFVAMAILAGLAVVLIERSPAG